MRRALLVLLTVVALQATAADWSYLYDGSGNIRQIGTDHYVYDVAGRLVQADTNGVRRNYEYDAFGNRKTCAQPGTDCQWGYRISAGDNRIVDVEYTRAGNLKTFAGHTYTYDADGMQTRDQSAAGIREYVYTADDERIAVYTVNTGTWHWSFRDTSGRVLREFTSQDSASGAPGAASWKWIKDYVWRDHLLLATRQIEPGATTPTTYHYHLDHLGTPRQITDDANRIVGTHHYYPFGPEQTQNAQNEPSRTSLKYTGHERDLVGVAEGLDTLDYMHARYYSGAMGRFLSADPTLSSAVLGKPQSWNRYTYVFNNPLNLTDPSGKCGESADFIGPTIACDFDYKLKIEVAADAPSEWQHVMWYTVETTADLTPWGPLPAEPADPWQLWQMYQEEQNPSSPKISVGFPPIVGPFSISNFEGYPPNLPRPTGPFQVLEGEEYTAARTVANNANRAMHRADPSLVGKEIHEIQPVKFGGSATDPVNKIPLTPTEHRAATSWWSRLLNKLLNP